MRNTPLPQVRAAILAEINRRRTEGTTCNGVAYPPRAAFNPNPALQAAVEEHLAHPPSGLDPNWLAWPSATTDAKAHGYPATGLTRSTNVDRTDARQLSAVGYVNALLPTTATGDSAGYMCEALIADTTYTDIGIGASLGYGIAPSRTQAAIEDGYGAVVIQFGRPV